MGFIFLATTLPELAAPLILLLVLLIFSGLISGSEVAFFSLSPNQTAKLREQTDLSSQRILRLRERPRSLLATILIVNNFINIAIVVLSDYILWRTIPATTFENWSSFVVQHLPFLEENIFTLTRTFNFLVTVAGVTFLLVLFGEVTPKVYAKVNNLKLARFMAWPLSVLKDLLWPVSKLLVNWSNSIEGRITRDGLKKENIDRKQEIDKAIDLTVSNDVDSASEIDILKSIVKFNDVYVRQIMTPRVNVIGLEFGVDYNEVLKVVKESGYSRLPVYQDDLDNIVGLLYIKDLIGKLEKDKDDGEWQELIRSNILYVPENKKINELLKEFQQKRMHMGIVVDEYGGCSGIVTLEDIMEEVIGEIRDEFDAEEELEYVKLDNRNYIFEGKIQLNDVCRIMGIDTNTFDNVRGEADTIAGLFLEILGRLPKQNQEITVGAFKFQAVVVNKRRIEKVKTTILY
ncbi:MAG: gliding motility-associated protein GldE [Saprospirales bacterium]|nr:MAG: gliding motility-associated protein GldE [Saprospirales bacterium]